MTDTGKRKSGAVWQGMVPDDHPIYRSGWNFLAGVNLKRPNASAGDDDGGMDQHDEAERR
jgi:hypothetical protein